MTDFEPYRADFERLHSPGSYGFSQSRKGNYVNPALARDWKWFCMGLIAAWQPKANFICHKCHGNGLTHHERCPAKADERGASRA